MRLLSAKVSQNHILRASVLLGRIMTLHSHLYISRDRAEYMTEFEKLENAVSLFYFALSCNSHENREATSMEPSLTFWLNTMVQTCNVLLYHPVAFHPSLNERNEGAGSTSGFPRCLNAARVILDVTKDTAKKSPDALVNPFLVTVYFLCCRFLSIAWYDDRNQSDRDDIDFVLLLVDVVGERWAPLAKKFRKGIMRDLGKNAEETRQMRVGTGCYLDVECA